MGGMDGFTGSLLLKTATTGGDGNDIAANLYKELNTKHAPSHAISQSHAILKSLGYIPGAIVEINTGMGAIGKIVDYRTNTGGLYDGLRYPVNVKGPGGAVYEQSIFRTHYEDVIHFEDPQRKIEELKDDLGLILVADIDNVDEVMRSQSELSKKNKYSLIEFLDNYEHPIGDKPDYVYKYALACLEKKWSSELELIKNAAQYIESKEFTAIENVDVKKLLEEKYYGRLSYYNDTYTSFGTPHQELISLYNYATGNHKDKIKNLLIDRTTKMDDNELYAYATLLKGTDIEGDILALLEQKMS